LATYLVTGGAGFIGSALVLELVRRGERVRVLDNFSTGHRRNLAPVISQIELFELDVTSPNGLSGAFEGADFVLQEAALPSVPRSVKDPQTSNLVNAQGTLNVLVQARDARVRRLIYAASSSVYGDSPTLPKHEGMPANPLSPYAVSKFCGEMYCKVFTQIYGLETVCLRYFNIFGPRQDPGSPYSGVLSLFITALLEGRRPTIYGNGTNSRDFTYVDNVVDANLRACTAAEAAGKVINIATGQQQTLNQSLAVLNAIIGVNVEPVYVSPRMGDIQHSLADTTLASKLLGYEASVSFDEGLRRTVEWYRDHPVDTGR